MFINMLFTTPIETQHSGSTGREASGNRNALYTTWNPSAVPTQKCERWRLNTTARAATRCAAAFRPYA